MNIKILGTGCSKCNRLEAMVKEVVSELGVEAEVVKVTGLQEIAAAGVMLTPALMINEQVEFCGKLPSKTRLANIIRDSIK